MSLGVIHRHVERGDSKLLRISDMFTYVELNLFSCDVANRTCMLSSESLNLIICKMVSHNAPWAWNVFATFITITHGTLRMRSPSINILYMHMSPYMTQVGWRNVVIFTRIRVDGGWKIMKEGGEGKGGVNEGGGSLGFVLSRHRRWGRR